MLRFLFKLLLCGLLAIVAGCAYMALRTGDSVYTFFEWISPARFQQYDSLIRDVAVQNNLDPMLVKAVVWRESRFEPKKSGSAGERGLMQVTEAAAKEWAAESNIENFQADDLFDPATNLKAGTWYLRRAFDRWQEETDPTPFALAEYNAGRSRAQRWAGGSSGKTNGGEAFVESIDFPTTRKYIETVIARYEFYKRRERM